jgi:hypothetical protein
MYRLLSQQACTYNPNDVEQNPRYKKRTGRNSQKTGFHSEKPYE